MNRIKIKQKQKHPQKHPQKNAQKKVKKHTPTKARAATFSTASRPSQQESSDDMKRRVERQVVFNKQSRRANEFEYTSGSSGQEDFYHQSLMDSTKTKRTHDIHPGSGTKPGGANVDNKIQRSSMEVKQQEGNVALKSVEYTAVTDVKKLDNHYTPKLDDAPHSAHAQKKSQRVARQQTKSQSEEAQYGLNTTKPQYEHPGPHKIQSRKFGSSAPPANKPIHYQQQQSATKTIFHNPKVYRSLNIIGDSDLGWKGQPLNEEIYPTLEEYQKGKEFLKEKKQNRANDNQVVDDVKFGHLVHPTAQRTIFSHPKVYRSLNIIGDSDLGWKREPLNDEIYPTLAEYEQGKAFLKQKKENRASDDQVVDDVKFGHLVHPSAQRTIFTNEKVYRSFNIIGDAHLGWKSESLPEEAYPTLAEYEKGKIFLKQKKDNLEFHVVDDHVHINNLLYVYPPLDGDIKHTFVNTNHNLAEGQTDKMWDITTWKITYNNQQHTNKQQNHSLAMLISQLLINKHLPHKA